MWVCRIFIHWCFEFVLLTVVVVFHTYTKGAIVISVMPDFNRKAYVVRKLARGLFERV